MLSRDPDGGMIVTPGVFAGCWLGAGGRLLYREVPKAACSTLAQLLYHADHGRFYPADIHDACDGTQRWPEGKDEISLAALGGQTFAFSAVRNPYSRILSAYFDKVCTLQRDGHPYRRLLPQVLAERYGFDLNNSADPIRNFRRFLLFVRDVVRGRERFWYDIHWTSQAQLLRVLPLNGKMYDHLFTVENFQDGLSPVLAHIPPATRPSDMPRFNTAKINRKFPISAYFDDLCIHMMQEVYRWDFELFGYARFQPEINDPIREIDLDAVNRRLSNPHAPHWAAVGG